MKISTYFKLLQIVALKIPSSVVWCGGKLLKSRGNKVQRRNRISSGTRLRHFLVGRVNCKCNLTRYMRILWPCTPGYAKHNVWAFKVILKSMIPLKKVLSFYQKSKLKGIVSMSIIAFPSKSLISMCLYF